jgi:hypothetical protein
MPLLTPTQRAAFERAGARCNECYPLIDFLEQMGVDVKEYQDRLDLLKRQSETALQLNAALKNVK